MNIYLTVAI